MASSRSSSRVSSISWGSRNGRNKNSPPSSIEDKQQRLVEIHNRNNICSVTFLVDGRHVVGGGDEGKIRRWRVEDGMEVGKPMDVGSSIYDIAASRDGKWIVSGAKNGMVMVWNTVESHEKVREFKAHNVDVNAVDVSPDGTRIATGSDDWTACVWSLSAGQRLLGPWEHDFGVVVVKFSPDGYLIATTTCNRESVRIYSNQTGDLLFDFPIKASWSLNRSVAWTSDSKQLFVLSRDGNVHCLDSSTGATRSQWSIHSSVEPRCIALAKNDTFIATSADSSVSFWDTTTCQQIGSVTQHTDRVQSMALSANYDFVICGGRRISLQTMPDILLLPYHISPDLAVQHMKEERAVFEQIIASLREREESAISKITHFEETVEKLNDQLSDYQQRATTKIAHLEQQLRNSQRRADTLLRALRVHEQTRYCETLYAEGRITDAAASFIEMTNVISEEVRANRFISDWLAKFKNQCVLMLETIGDNKLHSEKHDEAVAAYSTALSLGPSDSSALLTKWAHTVLIRSSASEALSSTAKFKLPRFLIYQMICDDLEQNGRILEAVETFHQLQSELAGNVGSNETAWITDFKTRCVKTLKQRRDSAMDSASYEDAIAHCTIALTLDPLLVDFLTERSKARVAIGSWESALGDANVVVELAPSSPYGYEIKRAALLGARRFDEAISAYNDMLLKLEQSPDLTTRELRDNYVSPSQTVADIHACVKQTHRDAPLILINTETGRLYDHQARTDLFESDPKFKELIASITTKCDDPRITLTVQQYFRYATFSHTWEGAEPLYHDVLDRSVNELTSTPTVLKLMMFCVAAREAGLRWAWSDTCCINKADGSVLQESLTSLFKWYHKSALTIVHLKDVLPDSDLVTLENCFWNTRAWTLQEFFASRVIRFYTKDWKRYHPRTRARSPTPVDEVVAASGVQESVDNDKGSDAILHEMATANGVDARLLLSLRPGSQNVRQKLCLAAGRMATKQEDIAYSLFGIFDVSISATYGEGQERALGRLLQEVLTRSGDVTILAWSGRPSEYNSCLPGEISVYREPASLYIPSLIEDDETETGALVSELRISSYTHSVMALYDKVAVLPSPRLFSRRLTLSCIVFRFSGRLVSKEDIPGIYSVDTFMLGNVEIKTMEDLSGQKLVLVHPWLKSLLDPSEDPIDDGDAELPTPLDRDGESAPSDAHTPPSHPVSLSRDKRARSLRLFARLRQPFGALLLSHQSHNDYKRVASDHPIRVQLQADVSPRRLAQMIRTLDIL